MTHATQYHTRSLQAPHLRVGGDRARSPRVRAIGIYKGNMQGEKQGRDTRETEHFEHYLKNGTQFCMHSVHARGTKHCIEREPYGLAYPIPNVYFPRLIIFAWSMCGLVMIHMGFEK